MKAVILEDESLIAKELQNKIQTVAGDITVVEVLPSLKTAKKWFMQNAEPDLIFMDIQLSDGVSFELFDVYKLNCPIIFTTAYDEYALKAFKVNSVDYLLKPVQKEELQAALQKYRHLHATANDGNGKADINLENLVRELQQKLQPKEFRKRFLVKHAQKLVSVEIDEIAYFYSDGRLNFFKTSDNKKYVVDYTMD